MSKISIEAPEGEDALTELVLFHDRVYEAYAARWTAFVPLELPVLLGKTPFTRGRKLRPLVAREDGELVARAVAVVDERYQKHWNEKLGHVVMFEALPRTRAAVKELMDAACEWLASQGAEAARAGFGMLEFPFVIDAYDSLPPPFVRQNPAYYHALLKDAGFETEKGWVDYKLAVHPDLVERWKSALQAAERAGYRMVPLAELPEAKRARLFTEVWNECFASHWGFSPFDEEEVAIIFRNLEPSGTNDVSLLAYQDDEPVGVLWIVPELSMTAATLPGHEVPSSESLNLLGIGVRKAARGRGVNLAMASDAYLKLVARGARHLSYTLVLDDNWPSRRTGEKLGHEVCASYVVYRRRFDR